MSESDNPKVGSLFRTKRRLHESEVQLPVDSLVMVYSVRSIYKKRMPEQGSKASKKQKHTGKGKNSKRVLIAWDVGLLCNEKLWQSSWGLRAWSLFFEEVAKKIGINDVNEFKSNKAKNG